MTARLSVLIVTDPEADSTAAHDIEEALTNGEYLELGVLAGHVRLPRAVAHLNKDVIVVRCDAGSQMVLLKIKYGFYLDSAISMRVLSRFCLKSPMDIARAHLNMHLAQTHWHKLC